MITKVKLEGIEREGNRAIMISWINHDLFERAACDVRRSIVLLDSDRMFVYALPSGEPLPGGEVLARLYDAGVRFYCEGV